MRLFICSHGSSRIVFCQVNDGRLLRAFRIPAATDEYAPDADKLYDTLAMYNLDTAHLRHLAKQVAAGAANLDRL